MPILHLDLSVHEGITADLLSLPGTNFRFASDSDGETLLDLGYLPVGMYILKLEQETLKVLIFK